ncbi:LysM peptidoglycan-binding domain-containing protein [Halopseudomonas pelagia]|uniref:LysM peptidoglycan-binding domain-containing protein n=1 Tax=Halopseudomonas pelagia TaxID=553151 RepID=UPI0003A7DFC7|nr:LysM peptidoglycan-binding domain-containing protein [Halopseudomonas pelagia]|tara:strand:+ start:45586 stop:47139 length:1554 start_codon:yes stop_codon:yes gene_type:complete
MRFSDPGSYTSIKILLAGLLIAGIAGCQSSPSSSRSGLGDRPTDAERKEARQITLLRSARTPRSAEEIESVYTLWSRIRQGFMLDPGAIDNPRVNQQRLLYVAQPRYFELTSPRAERYMHYVVEQLDARQMPLELALLPFVESGYNPMALSSSSAAGIWQFIPSTGEVFSLRQDSWYDGRRDITASTQAALDYLSKLANMFDGDWLLAIAAYNCGEGCVGRAIKRNQQLGLPTDYWNLQLPRETMNYVPKLLAMSQIIDRPSLHGTVLPELANTPYFTEVEIKRQLDLHKAAELADMPTEDFMLLNPAFKQRMTSPQGIYRLLVPVNRAEQFSAALANLPESERVSYLHYQVRSGDTLSQIARRHQLSVSAIRDTNQLNGNIINIGQTLILPQMGAGPAVSSPAPAQLATTQSVYRVKSGDSLWNIARAHGVSISVLREHNNIDSNHSLSAGQSLRIPGGNSSASPASPQSMVYTVKTGDSLYSIARQFNISIERIRKENTLDRHLRPGQQLTLLLR